MQQHLAAGTDAFPEEKEAEELAARLGELGAAPARTRPRRECRGRAARPGFPGRPPDVRREVPLGSGPQLEILRASTMSRSLDPGRRRVRRELLALLGDFDSVQTAEFLITRSR